MNAPEAPQPIEVQRQNVTTPLSDLINSHSSQGILPKPLFLLSFPTYCSSFMYDLALQRPPPYPYRSRSASVALPSYRAHRRHDEQTLVLQPPEPRSSPSRYVYRSQSMMLDLGQRLPGVSIPAYGNNAIVQGTLTVKDLKYVTDIAFTITGKACYTIFECGYPLLQHSKTVLQYSTPIWSSSHSQSRRDPPTTFSVSAPLPTYARWSSALLPPTTRFAQGNFKLAVTYEVAVQLTRSGKLRRDERLSTEFAYVPRTIPDAGPSIPNTCGSEADDAAALEENKSFGTVRWKAANVKPLTTIIDPASVTVYLPSPTSYPSGTPIHFRIVLSSPNDLNMLSPSSLLNSPGTLSVELVKLLSFRIGKSPVMIERVIGRGAVWKVEPNEDRPGWEATGCIEGTKKGSETSWCLGSFVECSYVVRTTINLPPPLHAPAASLPPLSPTSRPSGFTLSLVRSSSSATSRNKVQPSITYRHDEPIHLCTDEVEVFEVEADDAWERPAVGLLPNAVVVSGQQTLSRSKGKRLLKRVCSGLNLVS